MQLAAALATAGVTDLDYAPACSAVWGQRGVECSSRPAPTLVLFDETYRSLLNTQLGCDDFNSSNVNWVKKFSTPGFQIC